MSTPEKHGGGYVPALEARLSSFIQRGPQTEQPSAMEKTQSPSFKSGYFSPKRLKKLTNSTRNGGDFDRPSRDYATNLNIQAKVERPVRLEPKTHLQNHAEKHGGGYVPKIASSPHGARSRVGYPSDMMTAGPANK